MSLFSLNNVVSVYDANLGTVGGTYILLHHHSRRFQNTSLSEWYNTYIKIFKDMRDLKSTVNTRSNIYLCIPITFNCTTARYTVFSMLMMFTKKHHMLTIKQVFRKFQDNEIGVYSLTKMLFSCKLINDDN